MLDGASWQCLAGAGKAVLSYLAYLVLRHCNPDNHDRLASLLVFTRNMISDRRGPRLHEQYLGTMTLRLVLGFSLVHSGMEYNSRDGQVFGRLMLHYNTYTACIFVAPGHF